VFIEYGAPVRDGGVVIGRVARVQSTTGTTASLQTVLRLIGNDARILLGNADGSLWTDLERRIQRPPPTKSGLVTYERDGVRRISVSSPYVGTAIVAAVEMPEDVVLAPQRAVLWVLVVVGVVVVLLAGGVGWWASSGITRPIVHLTEAAERISAGDLASRIGDELSMPPVNRLAAAFETMRRSVKSAHDSLETQVADRTRELHEAQEELVRKERLATLGQLSSSVGHELRNPLGVMTNAVYFLEMTLKDVPQKVRDYLGILRTQVRLSEKIVSDLLDFARVKEPQRTAVALRQVVDEQLGRVTIPATVRVERDVPDTLPTVQVDAVQVGQVVLNLITNAAQAMEAAGGVLTLRAAANNGTVRLSVSDTGPGIAPENLAKVFEPLFTTKARGIGLGLSVSRSLAVANGGMLAVTSEPGHGAHFTLDLPTRVGA
jgi:signal transduction histidine kinase